MKTTDLIVYFIILILIFIGFASLLFDLFEKKIDIAIAAFFAITSLIAILLIGYKVIDFLLK